MEGNEGLLRFAFDPKASGATPRRIHRAALLFEAGDYPDKGVAVTEADLDRIIARFEESGRCVPVKVEHRDSALDPLGETVHLYRENNALYGMLAFGAGMDAHLRERNVSHLSVALWREPDETGGGFSLREVSVVLTPRVPKAGFLPGPQSAAVEATVAKFRREGKITPASEPPLRALLCLQSEECLLFGDGDQNTLAQTAAREVEKLLAALPIVQPRGALAVGGETRFAAFVENEENAPTGWVATLAAKFGVDARRVQGNLR